MSVVLSERLQLLASAPNGIQKLRGLVLELAVRGKLVPQDPNDEPASELLKKIAKARAKLEAEGKKSKPMSQVGEDEQPFLLPDGWAWGRINDIANSQAGFAFKSTAFNDARIGMPLIRIRDVGFSDPSTYFDGPYREEFVVTKGDYLISMDGQFRVAEWKGLNALLNQRVSRLQFYSPELAQAFFAISLHIRLAELQGIKAYTTVDHLSGGQISAAVVGVPPLAEQHRIVAKVDELMALCDRLEQEVGAGETAHAKLVESLLGTLTQSPDAADLAANWQRLAEHFDTLFTTEASLDALKQTVLQLAVMGRLVPQDPNDEPASELLKRVAKKRTRLEAEGKVKKSKPLPPVGDDERSFELPVGWDWIRLGQIGDWGAGATPLRSNSRYYGGPIPWFKSGELTADFISESEEHVTELALKECSLRQNNIGDVLIAMYGATIGKTAILATPATTNQAVCACTPNTGISNRYLLLLLKALKPNFIGQGAGGAQPNISREKIIATVAGLPPEDEQHRIVAKVDEMMALCDRLKADLAESRNCQDRLATTLIETALKAA